MVSLIFKYENKKPLDFVIPKSLEGYIEFLTHSRISEFPVYRTTNGLEFEKDIRTILNERNINELKIILRRKKIEKIIKKENLSLTLNYEFLDFWYNNYEDLFVLLPMEESVKF
jgi:hypothetical protein